RGVWLEGASADREADLSPEKGSGDFHADASRAQPRAPVRIMRQGRSKHSGQRQNLRHRRVFAASQEGGGRALDLVLLKTRLILAVPGRAEQVRRSPGADCDTPTRPGRILPPTPIQQPRPG